MSDYPPLYGGRVTPPPRREGHLLFRPTGSSDPPLYGGWVTPPPGRGRHQPACSSYPPLYGGWVTPPPGRGRHLPTGLVNIMRAVRLSHVQSFVALV